MTGDESDINSINDVMMDNEETDHIAQALASAMDNLSEADAQEKLKLFTDLSDEEIKHLSVLLTMDDQLMEDFADEFLSMKVSENRQGREELIDVAKGIGDIWGAEKKGMIQKGRDKLGI